MGNAFRYWQWVRIDATGQKKVEVVMPAKQFLRAQLSIAVEQSSLSDDQLQQRLFQLWYHSEDAISRDQDLAGLCLKCFISNVIAQVCGQLYAQFGQDHGFTTQHLYSFVLDHGPLNRQNQPHIQSSYQSLIEKILSTFDIKQGSLSTWTAQLVRRDRSLNTFLLEHGVYLISDWAILNDTTPQQVSRILGEFHSLTSHEIEHNVNLLNRYHCVYRRDRIRQRQAGKTGRCQEPSLSQLQKIDQLGIHNYDQVESQTVLYQLQNLASLLREYRIYARGGPAPTQSLDQLHPITGLAMQIAAPHSDERSDSQTQFLQKYRQQFQQSLDKAIEGILADKLKRFQTQKSNKSQQYLTALFLFHCQGWAMSDIAPRIDLKAQYQVTRLLQLKDLRADIRHQILLDLRDQVWLEAQQFTNPDRLQALNEQLDTLLTEQVDGVMQTAAAEASVPRNRPVNSLYAQRLCDYLDRKL